MPTPDHDGDHGYKQAAVVEAELSGSRAGRFRLVHTCAGFVIALEIYEPSTDTAHRSSPLQAQLRRMLAVFLR